MLSVNKNNRDRIDNELYNKMIAYLSNNNKDAINLPISPSKNKYLLLKKLGLHKMYSALKIKLQSR